MLKNKNKNSVLDENPRSNILYVPVYSAWMRHKIELYIVRAKKRAKVDLSTVLTRVYSIHIGLNALNNTIFFLHFFLQSIFRQTYLRW